MSSLEVLVQQFESMEHVLNVLSGNSPSWILERALKSNRVQDMARFLAERPYLLDDVLLTLEGVFSNPALDRNVQFAQIVSLMASIASLRSPEALVAGMKVREIFPPGSTAVLPEMADLCLKILQAKIESTAEINSQQIAASGELLAEVQTRSASQTVGEAGEEVVGEGSQEVIVVDFVQRRRV
ncbi:hypothetical protein [Bdellovibrio bacteriovorus]|uniref:hypothetical protein n=1 Tax=Bdellovibrio bacteriovorus TaxID=959 RepID=UPI003AA9784F